MNDTSVDAFNEKRIETVERIAGRFIAGTPDAADRLIAEWSALNRECNDIMGTDLFPCFADGFRATVPRLSSNATKDHPWRMRIVDAEVELGRAIKSGDVCAVDSSIRAMMRLIGEA